MSLKRLLKTLARANCYGTDGASGGDDGGSFSGGAGDTSVGDHGGYSGGGDIGGSGNGGGGFSSLGDAALGGIQSAMSDLGIGYGTAGAFSALGAAAAGGLDRGSHAADYGFGITEGKYAAEIAGSPLGQAIAAGLNPDDKFSHEFTDKGIEPTGHPTNWAGTTTGKEALGKANAEIAKERTTSIFGLFDVPNIRDMFGYNRSISPAGFNSLMAAGNTVKQGQEAFAAGMAETNKAGEIETDPLGVISSVVSPIATMLGIGPMGLMVDGPKPSTALSVIGSISDLGKLSAIRGALANPASAVSPGPASLGSGNGGGSGGSGGAGNLGGYAGGSSQSDIVGNVASTGGGESPQNGGGSRRGVMPSFGVDTKVRTRLPSRSLLSGLGKFGDDFNLLNLAKSLRG